jgi:hypothetical protein
MPDKSTGHFQVAGVHFYIHAHVHGYARCLDMEARGDPEVQIGVGLEQGLHICQVVCAHAAIGTPRLHGGGGRGEVPEGDVHSNQRKQLWMRARFVA